MVHNTTPPACCLQLRLQEQKHCPDGEAASVAAAAAAERSLPCPLLTTRPRCCPHTPQPHTHATLQFLMYYIDEVTGERHYTLKVSNLSSRPPLCLGSWELLHPGSLVSLPAACSPCLLSVCVAPCA